MFEIYRPSNDLIREIQERETAYYWSSCVECFLRKHGLIYLQQGGLSQTSKGFVIATRLFPCEQRLASSPGFFEGPLTDKLKKILSIDAEMRDCTVANLFDSNGSSIGRVAYPHFTVRKIPLNRKEVSEPYEYFSKNSYWNNKTIRFQELRVTGDRWHPVAYARIDGKDEKFLVGVSDGKQLVFGFPILDLIGQAHAFTPLDVGYYAHIQSATCFSVEEWLIRQLIDHSIEGGYPVIQIKRWPKEFQSAFTIRHDYDRLISDDELLSLLEYYQNHQIKFSWGFLKDKCNGKQAQIIASRGHEVALHSVASSFEEFEQEIQTLVDETGIKPVGLTAHGGVGAPGFLGETQYIWAEKTGMLYGEILGRLNCLPHPVNRIIQGMPSVGQLAIPSCHYSFDRGTKADAHHLEYMLENLPKLLERGYHVVLMNHPDIHIQELKLLLESIDLSNSWLATFEEVTRWCDSAKFRSQVLINNNALAVKFFSPLLVDTDLKVIFPGGGESKITCQAGTVSVKIILDTN